MTSCILSDVKLKANGIMEAPCLVCLNRSKFHLITVLLILLVVSARAGAAPDRTDGGLIPDLFVSMKGSDQHAYALVVEKRAQLMTLFKYDGRYQVVETIQISTGKTQGDKRVSGDKKTPEGVYFFTKAFGEQDLAPLYGTRAFPLDYPNFMDRQQGRNGYAIWMHGTNRPLKDRDSNGCIALVNRDIDKLAAYIALQDTPILIAEKITYKPVAKAESEDSAIQSFLSGWNNTLAKGSYHDYLSFYDSEYLPAISWWMKWMEIRKPGPSTAGSVDTELNYLGIYKHRELYVAMFDEMNESTAIFKCTNDPPVGPSNFMTYDGLPSDHYLWLTGRIGELLRGEIGPTSEIPRRQSQHDKK